MKTIILDLDGVINTSNGNFQPECVENLNDILYSTGAKVVLSSTWRYHIISGLMSVREFENNFKKNGVADVFEIVGVTPPDEKIPSRNAQIRYWLDHNKYSSYVIIDDFQLIGFDGNFVKTELKIGLTSQDAEKAIEILNGNPINN